MSLPVSHFSTQRRLFWALALSLVYIALLLAGSWASGSLTLAADSAHMLGHGTALGVALAASALAARVGRNSYSLGYKHIETIGGYTNGLLLTVISLSLGWEALERIFSEHAHGSLHNHEIDTGIMGAVALAGLVLHGVSAWILHGGRQESLNVHALYLHIFFDLAATLIGLATSVIIHFTGWEIVDSLAGLVIALFIFTSAVRIIRRSLRLLIETLPEQLEPEKIRARILSLPHVAGVHNMIFRPDPKTGATMMSAHIVLKPDCLDARHWEECRRKIEAEIRKFGVSASVLQIETADPHADPHANHH